MSLAVNYKLLNKESNATSEFNQLIYIFNKLYGGDITSEISDSVSIVAEAGIMHVISSHPSTDFYEKRAVIESEIFEYLKVSFKDYFLTCSSVYILNMEYDLRYQSSVLKVMAESQKITEKNSLLESTRIQAETAKRVANITQEMAVAQAKTDGDVYAINKESQANATIIYNSQIQQAVTNVGTFTSNANMKTLYNFFYLLVG